MKIKMFYELDDNKANMKMYLVDKTVEELIKTYPDKEIKDEPWKYVFVRSNNHDVRRVYWKEFELADELQETWNLSINYSMRKNLD